MVRSENFLKTVPEWTVSNQSHTTSATERQQFCFHCSVDDAVSHLVGDDWVVTHVGLRLGEFSCGEVAHSDKAHFALLNKLFHSTHCLFDRHRRVSPMQLI